LLRADLLPPADAANVRSLLGAYLDQRILFYIDQDYTRQTKIGQSTSLLQGRSLGCRSRTGYRTANSGYRAGARRYERRDQFAWLYAGGVLEPASRRCVAAHVAIALCSNVLCGFRPRDSKAATKLAFVLPFVIAIAFLLIADIDAPRRGLTHARPQNLEALVKSFDR
jgi:hypothetical protein